MTRTRPPKEIRVDAWMPLYIGDWDSGTRHLTCEQDGAYGRLVRWYWRNGAPRNDDKILAQIVGMTPAKWKKNREILVSFFSETDGFLVHHRVEHELEHWTEKKRVFTERAAAGGRAKAAKSTASSTSKAVLNGCTSPSPWKEEEPIEGSSSLPGASASPSPAKRQATPTQDSTLTPQQIAYLQERGIEI